MKTKQIILVLVCLLIGVNSDAQIFKKLKEKVLGSESKEVATTSTNPALEINTEAKKAFFKEDVVIKIHENGNLNQTQYFDADQVAAKLEQDDQPKSGYIDSEGFIYGYNESEGAYNKSSLVALQSQGMMVPTMMLEAYKLPSEPFMANLQKQQDQGLTANPFNGIVEFAFVYEPKHFRYQDFKETKQTTRGKTYTKFDFLNEPGYEGSYVLFDDKDRLVEIYTNKADTGQPSNNGFQMDMVPPGESRLIYDYKPVDVKLPPATEKRAAGQDLMEMVMGSFKKDKNTEDIDEDDYDTSDSKGQTKSVKNALKNNKVTPEMLPESYEFDYLYKTTMVMESKKGGTTMDMNFLINTKNANYNGSEYVDRNQKNQGKMTMVFDSNLGVMVMFMDYNKQKMFQLYPVPEVKSNDTKVDFTIQELPPKTILGFTCTGLQLENEKYTMIVYHAKDAPISLSNFFGGSSASKNLELPDLDPRLLKQFENGLVMEMQYADKKKQKNNFTITAQSLEKVPSKIIKADYKSMNMFSGAGMFKN